MMFSSVQDDFVPEDDGNDAAWISDDDSSYDLIDTVGNLTHTTAPEVGLLTIAIPPPKVGGWVDIWAKLSYGIQGHGYSHHGRFLFTPPHR